MGGRIAHGIGWIVAAALVAAPGAAALDSLHSPHAKSRPALLPPRPAPLAAPAAPVMPRSTLFFQGFEGGVPPTGWTRTASSAVPFTWHATTDSTIAHEGIRTAAVDWTNAASQDERLTSPVIDLSGVTSSTLRLEFWWYGNPFWAANADFVVLTSADGTAWTERWRMGDFPATGFAWRFGTVDVASSAGGALFVRLHYVGRDGADLLVDEVRVVADEPVGAAPANDDCAGAVSGAFTLGVGPFDVSGDNTLAAANYPLVMPGSCTGYSHAGRDLVWAVDLAEGHSIQATMTTTGHWDDTLFLISNCANAQTSCVAGDNTLPDGSTLAFTRTAPGTARYYLVASGYANGAGPFRLQGAVGPATAVQPASWGRVKARYR